MSQQRVNVGTTANDGTGDPLRTAFQRLNGNFDELYGVAGTDTVMPGLEWYNVKNYGAIGDGVTDNTTAIQRAIDDANAAAYGAVYIPAAPNSGYLFSQLKYYPGTRIIGGGYGGTFGGSRGTWLYQNSGLALEMLVPYDATIQTNDLFLQDIGFSAFNNQATNAGGILLEKCQRSRLVRVSVTYTKVYGIKIKGGTAAGDAMYNTLHQCSLSSIQSGASVILLTSSASSQPDATAITNTEVNADCTWITVDGTASRGADTLSVLGSHFVTGSSVTALSQQGTMAQFIGNRFETTSGGGTLTVTIAPSAGATSPSMFVANSWAAPGGLTWTDTASGVRRSPRIAEMTTGGPLTFIPSGEDGVNAITYSASMTPNADWRVQTIVATNGTAFTINAPTNARTGRHLIIDLKNSSGGSLGAITMNGVFLPAGAMASPANTKRRTTEFYYDGTNWVEVNRAAADI